MSGPLPSILKPITIPASWVYRAIINRRNARFDAGTNVLHIDRPVISVGNITTGGTGKTPMVQWIVRELIEAGHHPAIAMRGYKATSEHQSDEQQEYEARFADVPVIVGGDRHAAITEALPHLARVDCIVLDDGFQHRFLHRDLDLVLIDSTQNTMNDSLLPAGHLREPLPNLSRADAVVITRTVDLDDALAQSIASFHGNEPIAWCDHNWSKLTQFGRVQKPEEHDDDEDHVIIDPTHHEDIDVSILKDKRVCTAFGVGNPQAVRDQVNRVGGLIAQDIPLRDHARFTDEICDRIARASEQVDAVLVTAKDWVKLEPVLDWSRMRSPVMVPRVTLHFAAGEDALRQLILNAAVDEPQSH